MLPGAAALQRLLARLSSGIDRCRRAGAIDSDAWTGSGYAIALYILLSAVISVAATVPLPDYTNRDISEERAYGSVPVASAVPVEASPDG